MFAPSLAYSLNAGFVPVRKPGKLPAKTFSQSYELEYGTDRLEIHEDAIGKGERVLIVDDVIATGGTARATAKLVEGLGGDVAGFGFIIELTFLPGRAGLEELRSRIAHPVLNAVRSLGPTRRTPATRAPRVTSAQADGYNGARAAVAQLDRAGAS